MIKVVTALGNPSLNYELKNYSEFEIIGNDIQYMDGIVEVLEQNNNVDYIIISEILDGQLRLINLIDIIYKINKKIKVIVILNERNIEIEESLIRKGIHDILYNNTDIIEIVNLLKTRNVEILNKELRDEIDELKKIILEKNSKKVFKIKNNNYSKKGECKVIAITGSSGVGKTSFSVLLANELKKKYKILLIDFDLVNSDINIIYKIKNNYIDDEIFSLKDYRTAINNKFDVITGFNYLFYSKKIDIKKLEIELREMKNSYDYIIVDTYSDPKLLENKIIYSLCDDIILLTGINNLELKKSQKLLNMINRNLEVSTKKVHIVLYKYKIIDLIFYRKFIFKKVFENIDVVGKIRYINYNNLYINNCFRKIYFNLNIKKFCLLLIKKLNELE